MPSLLVIKKLAAALETTMASLMQELEADSGDTRSAVPAAIRGRKKATKG